MFTLFEDDLIRVAARCRETENTGHAGKGHVLLSFTGVGHAMGGLDVQKPEFFGAARAFDNVIFITDKQRSWGNNIDFPGVAARLYPVLADRHLSAIGNSMGGFNAILATRTLAIRTVIAFAPQFSVNPHHAPWENRWARYTASITSHAVSHAGDYINANTVYWIFSSGQGLDRRHGALFPVADNIRHFQFSGSGHDVAADLKENGNLSTVVQACLDGSLTLGTLRGLPILEVEQLSPADPDVAAST